jgi:hypothetical protein
MKYPLCMAPPTSAWPVYVVTLIRSEVGQLFERANEHLRCLMQVLARRSPPRYIRGTLALHAQPCYGASGWDERNDLLLHWGEGLVPEANRERQSPEGGQDISHGGVRWHCRHPAPT